MRWEEASDNEATGCDADVIDVAFRLSARWIPVDHASALRDAVAQVLPWLGEEPAAGIHSIHGAASGNGWVRPGRESGDVLVLSRRTQLVLRVPVHRTDDVDALGAQRLDVGGCELLTSAPQRRPLRSSRAVFARYVVDDGDGDDEERFLERIAADLEARSIRVRKLLCGRSHRIDAAGGALATRSVLIADLGRDESLAIQCRGIGPGRLLGCGLFVPHKDIGPVGGMDGEG